MCVLSSVGRRMSITSRRFFGVWAVNANRSRNERVGEKCLTAI